MRLLAGAMLALFGISSLKPDDKIGVICSGSETVQIGTRTPQTLQYSLAFSADLKSKVYCYDRCERDQTFEISDSHSNPIKLADIHKGQTRIITFDRQTSVLTDYSNFDAGVAQITRRASAHCRPAEFHEPPTPK